ncbi:hypothetical protein BDZ89DRAFT_1150279 [Hymenopellis radicata]|nr:hypothetical protein BDZ89DRAFT_1150279 [Hymenopellis radicata]
MKTIHDYPHLFHISTPVNIDRLASMVSIHPNRVFVVSVLRTLRIGLWPSADTDPTGDFPETWDNAWANIPSAEEREFVLSQCKEEVEKGQHSPPFRPDLLQSQRLISSRMSATSLTHCADTPRPALCNLYVKMSGKHRAHTMINLNKALVRELLWFIEHVEASSGMLFFANIDWNPLTEANLTIYYDASLTGMGFWIPDLNVGFTCTVNGDTMRDKIFFWEALCVLAAIEWYTESGLTFLATPKCPVRIVDVNADSKGREHFQRPLHAPHLSIPLYLTPCFRESTQLA